MNLLICRRVRVHSDEVGLWFHDGEFRGLIGEGRRWLFDPLGKSRVDVVSLRAPQLVHEKLDVIVRSGVLEGRAVVLNLKDGERALVWIDGRIDQLLAPGLFAFWTSPRDVRVEVLDAAQTRFEHPQLAVILNAPGADRLIEAAVVEPHRVAVLFVDGRYVETLPPGQYAFWKRQSSVRLQTLDLRESMFDVVGQEIMTADKVTLRLNAVVVYRIVDALRSASVADDLKQSLYREAQLALRSTIGGLELDAFLSTKEKTSAELTELVRPRARNLGVELLSLGVRDVILPGEMKELMNRVTEAKKAAEADLITRREETAAMRSQANTARLLAENPTLMRLRELEILEKVAANSKLNVLLGERGLAERVVNLL